MLETADLSSMPGPVVDTHLPSFGSTFGGIYNTLLFPAVLLLLLPFLGLWGYPGRGSPRKGLGELGAGGLGTWIQLYRLQIPLLRFGGLCLLSTSSVWGVRQVFLSDLDLSKLGCLLLCGEGRCLTFKALLLLAVSY